MFNQLSQNTIEHIMIIRCGRGNVSREKMCSRSVTTATKFTLWSEARLCSFTQTLTFFECNLTSILFAIIRARFLHYSFDIRSNFCFSKVTKLVCYPESSVINININIFVAGFDSFALFINKCDKFRRILLIYLFIFIQKLTFFVFKYIC